MRRWFCWCCISCAATRPSGAFSRAFERPVQAEACRLAGLSPEDSDGMLQRLREDFDPLSEQRLGELLEDTGFVLPSRYFQAVGYQTWIAFRAG